MATTLRTAFTVFQSVTFLAKHDPFFRNKQLNFEVILDLNKPKDVRKFLPDSHSLERAHDFQKRGARLASTR